MNQEVTEAIGSELVGIKKAAQMLDVSVRTVWRMIADNELNPVRIRRCTRLRVTELFGLLQRNRNGGTQ